MAEVQAKKKHSDLITARPLAVANSFSKMLSENAKLGAFPHVDPKAENIFISSSCQKKANVGEMTNEGIFSLLKNMQDERGNSLHQSFVAAALLEFLERHKNGGKAEIASLLQKEGLDMAAFLEKHVKPKIKSIEFELDISKASHLPVGKQGKMSIGGRIGF